MDRKHLAQMMDSIAKVYPNFLLTNGVMNAWHEYVGELDYEIVREAVKRYVRENEFAPTVAGIMKHYRAIEQERYELDIRLLENYNIITGLYPRGGSNEAETAYMEFLNRFPPPKRLIVAQRMVRSVSEFVDKAVDEIPPLAEYIGGLNEQASGDGGNKCPVG